MLGGSLGLLSLFLQNGRVLVSVVRGNIFLDFCVQGFEGLGGYLWGQGYDPLGGGDGLVVVAVEEGYLDEEWSVISTGLGREVVFICLDHVTLVCP